MKEYRCDEMVCDGCVSRIDRGLTRDKIPHKVNLETKTVMIENDEDCQKAVKILDDMGFTAVEQ